jgi:hypothetical protein
MKRLTAIAVLALVTAAPDSVPAADTVEQRFRWLAGCWAGTKGTTSFQEQWTVASPDLMLGMSFTTKQPDGGRSANKPQKPTEFEFLRIESKAGVPTYMAQPQGVPPTPFALSERDSTADTAMFVNMAHDFPKRVAYKKVDATSLLASIDAGPKGSLRIEFPMKRAACPGAGGN